MGNTETRQEVTGRDPEEEKDSRTAAGAVRNQLSNPTVAGEKRHTVNEPRNPESSSAVVVTGQVPVTQQPQSEISLFGKDPEEGDPERKEDNAAGYACRKKDYDNPPRKAGYSGKGYIMTVWSRVNARLELLFLAFESNCVKVNTDIRRVSLERRHQTTLRSRVNSRAAYSPCA